jgi:hypothetical protein
MLGKFLEEFCSGCGIASNLFDQAFDIILFPLDEMQQADILGRSAVDGANYSNCFASIAQHCSRTEPWPSAIDNRSEHKRMLT